VIKLGEEEKGNQEEPASLPPSLLGPQDFWAHTRHPRPPRAALGSWSSLCAWPPHPTWSGQAVSQGRPGDRDPSSASSPGCGPLLADRHCQSPRAEGETGHLSPSHCDSS